MEGRGRGERPARPGLCIHDEIKIPKLVRGERGLTIPKISLRR